MRDLCARVGTWAPLSGWPLEVICCDCLETPFERPPFSTAEGFRRVFEVSILLTDSWWDPWFSVLLLVCCCLGQTGLRILSKRTWQIFLIVLRFKKLKISLPPLNTRSDLWRIGKFIKYALFRCDSLFQSTPFQVLGVKEQTSMQPMLEPELELDVTGEPERKRLALMGATASALGIQAPPGAN